MCAVQKRKEEEVCAGAERGGVCSVCAVCARCSAVRKYVECRAGGAGGAAATQAGGAARAGGAVAAVQVRSEPRRVCSAAGSESAQCVRAVRSASAWYGVSAGVRQCEVRAGAVCA